MSGFDAFICISWLFTLTRLLLSRDILDFHLYMLPNDLIILLFAMIFRGLIVALVHYIGYMIVGELLKITQDLEYAQLIFVKTLISKSYLLFVILVINSRKFAWLSKNWILICQCIFWFKVPLFNTFIIEKFGSDIFYFHFWIVVAYAFQIECSLFVGFLLVPIIKPYP